jgi:hypothetical protein
MAHLGISQILSAKGGYRVQGSNRVPGSLYGNVGYRDREHASSARWRTGKKEGNERQGAPPAEIVVVEQWICFVLGFGCMALGIWGIFMEPEHDALSAYIAWLGSLYVPTLRVTAVVCIGLGVVLARWAWAHN